MKWNDFMPLVSDMRHVLIPLECATW